MHKITMNKFKRRKRKITLKKNIILITILLVLLNTVLLITIYSKKIAPVILDVSKIKLQEINNTLIINNIKSGVIKNIDVDQILIPVLNKSNEIISIDYNLDYVYEIIKDVSANLKSSIKLLENGNVKSLVDEKFLDSGNHGLIAFIPTGSAFNVPSVANLGPKIPSKIMFIGNIFANLETKVTSYGLNNALLEIYLVIDMNNRVIIPLNKEDGNYTVKLLLCAKAIQGKVPHIYGGSLIKETEEISIS